jgi:uncharacterized membrane protein SpoIIM required for sporulation
MLYRRTAGDLAIAARDFPAHPVSEYLNGLVARAHPLLYRGPSPKLGRVLDFYAVGLPRAVRAARAYLLASAGLFLLGAVAGWLTVLLRPDLVATLVPPQVLDGLSQGHLGNDLLRQQAPAVAAFIIQNNVFVSLACLAGGIGLGLPTAFMLATNGWTLGTLGAAVHQAGFDARFWALIVPHGAIELSVIAIAGAAGLMIGDSLLRPGLLRRTDALTRAAQRALVLAQRHCWWWQASSSPSSLPRTRPSPPSSGWASSPARPCGPGCCSAGATGARAHGRRGDVDWRPWRAA